MLSLLKNTFFNKDVNQKKKIVNFYNKKLIMIYDDCDDDHDHDIGIRIKAKNLSLTD